MKNMSYEERHNEIMYHLRIMTGGAKLHGHSLLLIATQRLLIAAHGLTYDVRNASVRSKIISKIETAEHILQGAKAATSSGESN